MSMKTIVMLFIFLAGIIGCQNRLQEPILSASGSVTLFQQFVLDEVNLVRTNPAGYAELRLKADMIDSTDNGSYSYVKHLTPLNSLTLNSVLNLSATNYATFLAGKNLMGHNEDGTPLKRAIIAGFEGSVIGENIAACTRDIFNAESDPQAAAINFVRVLIIDQGIKDFGHRNTILNSKYKSMGVGFFRSSASAFINYTVHDFGNI